MKRDGRVASTADVVVRAATPDDERAVSALLQASYPNLMPSAYDAAALAAALPAMTRANPVLLASGTFYVGAGRGQLVSCGGWTRERPGSGETEPGLAHLRHFATDPQWTGHGVGRAIFETCEAAARAAGFERFECYASLNAEGFYAALGFTAVRRIDLPMGRGLTLPSVVMVRDLA